MRVIGVAGFSGSGKTTLITRLLPVLTAMGATVSTIKQANRGFDLDRPGKDSFLHRSAGAVEVMVASSDRFALIREHRGHPEPDLDALLGRMAPVDLVLVEGFKRHRHPQIEVHRPALGKPLLAREDPNIVAVAGDEPPREAVPVWLSLEDLGAIADLVIRRSEPVGIGSTLCLCR
jgi:molybdopterin-guanine dinucleotide biosynthesis protein B